jgi:hypothetical protein
LAGKLRSGITPPAVLKKNIGLAEAVDRRADDGDGLQRHAHCCRDRGLRQLPADAVAAGPIATTSASGAGGLCSGSLQIGSLDVFPMLRLTHIVIPAFAGMTISD